MNDWGDEFVIQSTALPWLIWIQLLVMFLLVILLYLFGIFSLDHSTAVAATAVESNTDMPTSNRSHIDDPSQLNLTSCSYRTTYKVRGIPNIEEETGTSTSKGGVETKEGSQEEEGSLTKDVTHVSDFGLQHRPCHLLVLARQVFLKCFGFDSIPLPSNKKHRK